MDKILKLTEEEGLKYCNDYTYRNKLKDVKFILKLYNCEILKLTLKETLKYYGDEKYREELKNENLILNFHSNISIYNKIMDANILVNVNTLYLSDCQGIKDVGLLKNVCILKINFSEEYIY
jgi:hypothetical protein